MTSLLNWAAGAALTFFLTAVHAQQAPDTLTVGGTLKNKAFDGTEWTLSGMTGSGTLSFSDQLISALNTSKVELKPVAPVSLQAPKDGSANGGNYLKSVDNNGDGIKDAASVFASSPVQSLSGIFDGNSLAVSGVVTQGGLQQLTIKNGATTGPGELRIKNLRVAIGDRAGFAGTIYADLSSTTAGFANRSAYALWTFDELRGPTTFDVPADGQVTVFNVSNSLHGLFFVNQDEAVDLFAQALALNTSLGKPALRQVNRRDSTTNFDPITGKIAGFGWINSTIAVTATPTPVPESSTLASFAIGLLSVILVTVRERAYA